MDVVVGVSERFGRLLRRSVRRTGPSCIGTLSEGQWVVCAVQARRRGQHQLAGAEAAAQLENVLRAGRIRFDIGARPLDALLRSGPRRQMKHSVVPPSFAGREQRFPVCDIGPNESKARVRFELEQPPSLDAGVVGIIQVVDTVDLEPAIQQLPGNPMPDEASHSRQQIGRHRSSFQAQSLRRWGAEMPFVALRVSRTSGAVLRSRV